MKLLPSSLICLFLAAGAAFAGEPTVKLTPKADTVEVTIGGEPFTVYNFSRQLPKPFFAPVRGPGGVVMTRPIAGSADEPQGAKIDHPHHKGIWVSIDEVNEVKFWAEKGKIANVSVKPLAAEENPAKLEVVNHWQGEDGEPIVVEKTVIGIHGNRLLTYDITFTAGKSQVTFDDTKEGLLGFRMVDSMREKEGGVVVNSDGLEGSKECWGKPADWVDYYGPVEGKVVGVALFDHPQNFRRSRYHVRDYGLFSVSPFGEGAYSGGKSAAGPLVLEPGKSVRLRYGVFLHAGDTKAANVATVYQEYVKAAN